VIYTFLQSDKHLTTTVCSACDDHCSDMITIQIYLGKGIRKMFTWYAVQHVIAWICWRDPRNVLTLSIYDASVEFQYDVHYVAGQILP